MSNINYNKQRYIELLKLKYLQKKVLTSIEEAELNKYLYVLEETLDWETKDQYVDLLEQFLSGEINSFTFSIKFKERNDLNTEAFNNLKANFILLSPHEQSKEFSDFISEIIDFCYSYSEVFDLGLPQETRDSYELDFRNFMEKIHFKIQKVLNEE
jgi:hypothetical protein